VCFCGRGEGSPQTDIMRVSCAGQMDGVLIFLGRQNPWVLGIAGLFILIAIAACDDCCLPKRRTGLPQDDDDMSPELKKEFASIEKELEELEAELDTMEVEWAKDHPEEAAKVRCGLQVQCCSCSLGSLLTTCCAFRFLSSASRRARAKNKGGWWTLAKETEAKCIAKSIVGACTEPFLPKASGQEEAGHRYDPTPASTHQNGRAKAQGEQECEQQHRQGVTSRHQHSIRW